MKHSIEKIFQMVIVIYLVSILYGCQTTSSHLHESASKGDLVGINSALDEGNSIDARDAQGMTPILLSAKHGHTDVTRSLIKLGANVNAVDNTGKSPIFWAAREGNTEVINLLIEQDVSIDTRDQHGISPFMISLLKGHNDIAELLFDYNADVDGYYPDGSTPLLVALKQGYLHLSNRLIPHIEDLDGQEKTKVTPLMIACQNGYKESVELLLDGGAAIDSEDSLGITPLMYACGYGHKNIVESLIRNNANINLLDRSRINALHYAAYNSEFELVRLLIAEGSKIEPVTKTGEDLYATAIIFEAKAELEERFENRSEILENLREADKYYSRATKLFEKSYKSAKMYKTMADVSNTLKIVGSIVGPAIAERQAKMQNRQFAQVAAVKYAGESGTGTSGYYSYMDAFDSQARLSNISSSSALNVGTLKDTAELKRMKKFYAGMVDKSKNDSERITQVIDCFDSHGSFQNAIQCRNNI